MVFFHGYVKLPEGKLRQSRFQHAQGSQSLLLFLMIRTWLSVKTGSTPNKGDLNEPTYGTMMINHQLFEVIQ